MIRKFKFQAADGTLIEMDCDERFMAMIREKIGLLSEEPITEAHVKHVFNETIKGVLRT